MVCSQRDLNKVEIDQGCVYLVVDATYDALRLAGPRLSVAKLKRRDLDAHHAIIEDPPPLVSGRGPRDDHQWQ